MFQYHVIHRLHKVWINIFTISKNLRAAGLIQNQAELSPVFNCVLSVQSLKKPELGMNIRHHLPSKSLPHLGYFQLMEYSVLDAVCLFCYSQQISLPITCSV